MKKIYTLFCAVLVLLFFACDKDPDFHRVKSLDLSKICTAGSQNIGKPHTCVATLWNDGQERLLSSESTFTTARSIISVNGKTYIAGIEKGSATDKPQAVLWVNFEKQILPSDAPSEAYSVAADIGVTYVAGIEYRQNGEYTPILWTNGERRVLESRSGNAVASSVSAAGSDVYIAGYETDCDALPGVSSYAVLWKNGTQEILDAGNRTAMAYSVFIDGSDVYIAGCVYGGESIKWQPALWKNGALQVINTKASAIANAVYVHNGDVYLAGNIQSGSHSTATLWRDGIQQRLPLLTGVESSATSLYVDDNEYYVAGYENEKAMIWLDGIRYTVSNNRYEARAYSICAIQ